MKQQLKIKVCGMRKAENIRDVEALGVDMMGFIFWPKSSRYVSERPTYLPSTKRVGVFVDEEIKQVKRIADEYSLDYIQLHGSESPDYIRRLLSICGDTLATIKAFNIATTDDLEATKAYEGLVDYFLFDTKGKCVGGNGEKFDWSVLASYDGATPFLLSGGIGPDDAERICNLFCAGNGSVATKCVGIDLNSRFEVEPGIKDINKLKQFLERL